MLINNAGILRDVLWRWRKPRLSADGFEIHWRTNYLGTFHLTRLLLPMLRESGRKSGDARVINVSSHQHDKGSNARLFGDTDGADSWTAYGQSKLALIHHSFELQRRYAADCNLRSAALHPGSAYSNMTFGWQDEPRWLRRTKGPDYATGAAHPPGAGPGRPDSDPLCHRSSPGGRPLL